MEAGLTAAKRGLLGMGEALTDFAADESVRLVAHEGAVNLYRARLHAPASMERRPCSPRRRWPDSSRATVAQTCGLIDSLEIAGPSRSAS
jgi:hypothetical protein